MTLICLSLVSLAACGGARGSLTFVPDASEVGSVESILVSTVRERVDGQPVFTRERVDRPIFARFEISVPPEREVGSVHFPEAYPPDPRTDFLTVGARTLPDEAAFVAAINAALAADPRSEKSAVIFVHGFNTNFAEGLYRQAQLQHDYESHAASVHFAWPSAGDTRLYVFDRESALFARTGLETTLDAMARSSATKINLFAHSMGAFLTMDTLATMARLGNDRFFSRVNAVILLSPDVEIDVFRQQARQVLARGVPIFVVVSERDRALLVSARLRGERKRLGSIASPEEIGGDLDINVIDLTDVAGGGLGHFAIATSPELIELLAGMREQGVDVLETDRQPGVIDTSVELLRRGTDIVFAPFQQPVR
jgi:esterase/lipase superfamily enzyme